MKHIRNIYLFYIYLVFCWQLLLTLLIWSTNYSSGNGLRNEVRKIQIERWDREREGEKEQKKARNWRMQMYTNGKMSVIRHTSLYIPYLIMINSFSVNESCVFHLPRFFPSKIPQVVPSFDTLFPPSASRTGGHSTRSEVLTCLFNMLCPWCWHASILSLVLRVEALTKHRSVII